jgi:hypothetical protein
VCPFRKYIEETSALSDLEAVRYMSGALDQIIQRTRGKGVSNPLGGLLDGSRTVHRKLLAFTGAPGTLRVHKYLTGRSFSQLEVLRAELLAAVTSVVSTELQDSDLLLDVPRIEKTTDQLAPLYVYDPERGQPYQALSELSDVVKSLCTEFLDLTKECRVYLSPAVYNELDARKLIPAAKKEIESILSGKAKRIG